MKKLFYLVLIIIVCLYACVYDKSENTVVIYSSLEQYRNDDMHAHLKERFPEYDIQIMYLPTAKVAAKIKSEGIRTDADILVGVETGYLEMISDYLGDAAKYSTIEYMPGINPEHGKYVIWESYGGGFAVNTKILEKYGLPEPRTYEDLLKPEYMNLIATQDPKSSSTGYNFYLNRVNELGLDGALDYYDKLNDNVKLYSESSSGPVKMLIQGEVAVSTALTYQIVTEINKGNPLKMIFPPEGSPMSLDGITFIKGRDSDSRIVEILDYLMNEYIAYDKAMYNPGRILVEQPSLMENYPENIVYADMTGLEDLNVKEELLKKWKY